MPIQPVDTSIYGTLGAQQQSPIAMLGQFANAQNALNQNALFQQTYRARAALGPIAQQSVGPDGQMDWSKYAVGVSTHPDTAWMAPDILNQIAQKKLLDAQTINAELTGYEKRMGITSQIAAAAYKDPSIDLTKTMSDMLASGGIKDGNKQALIAWGTQMQNLPPNERRQRMGQFAMTQEAGRNALSQINGAYDPALGYTQDGRIVPGWRSSVTGQANPLMNAGQQAQAQPTGAPQAAPAAGGGTPASAPAAPAAPSQSPVTLGQPSPRLDYMNKTYYPQLQQAAQSAQNLINVIGEGKQLLSSAASGRAAPARIEIARWLTSAGVSEQQAREVAGGDPYTSQALQKLILYIGTQGMRTANEGNAAVRSVQEWNKFMEANPNLSNDKQSITKMWDWMKYQASLTTQEQKEFNNWSDQGKDVTKFPAEWNDFVDESTKNYFESRKPLYGK